MGDAFLDCCDELQPIDIVPVSGDTPSNATMRDLAELDRSLRDRHEVIGAVNAPKRRRTAGTDSARKCNLKLTVPDMVPGETLSCLFFEVDKSASTKTVGVPLWPHYEATFASQDIVYGNSRIWIQVSNCQDWFLETIN